MTDGIGGRAVAIARDWIGTPYQHQASCRGAGADCLGLIRAVWRELYGTEPEAIPAYTWDWAEAGGAAGGEERLWAAAQRHLSRRQPGSARPGDVLLFRMAEGSVAKHLGLLSRGGAAPSFIHAYCGHGVVESALSLPWSRRVVACFAFPERIS
ncbi:NlpC/P60 family protein [Palleronia sp. KMU-117]|uniref:NlpC/P60 family protein n=1 Tax=Palleronia sp. KMU-117 TaxID=3434108 RepID=UPI003D72BC30